MLALEGEFDLPYPGPHQASVGMRDGQVGAQIQPTFVDQLLAQGHRLVIVFQSQFELPLAMEGGGPIVVSSR